MNIYTKINIIIGVILLIGSFVIVTFNPNFNGLFVGIVMALMAFLNLKIAQSKLIREKKNSNDRN